MQVQYKVHPQIIVNFEADKATDIFNELASLQELFSNTECGACKSNDIRFVVRKDEEENEYYELVCNHCRSRLPFGQKKKPSGSLYPKKRWDSLSDGEKENRKDEEEFALKNFGLLPNGGWFKFKGKKK